jgi:hypothetical protein
MEFCVPNVMNVCDIEDIVALVSPTPMYISATDDDKWSRGAQQIFDFARPCFSPENFETENLAWGPRIHERHAGRGLSISGSTSGLKS